MNEKPKTVSQHYRISNGIDLCRQSMPIINTVLYNAKNRLRDRLGVTAKITNSALEEDQFFADYIWRVSRSN